MDNRPITPLRVMVIDSTTGNDYAPLLCGSLQRDGVDVRLVTTVDRSQELFPQLSLLSWAPSKRRRGLRLSKLVQQFVYLARLFGCALRRRVDIVHYHFMRHERTEFLCLPLLRLLRIKVVTTAHNILPHEPHLIDRFVKTVIFRSSHLVIAHSDFIKQQLIQKFNLPEGKISIVPHGNFDAYLPDPMPSRESARAQLGLSPTDDVLLFFGYIRAYKGLDLLLDAFELAGASCPHLKLLVAGAPHTRKLVDHYRARIARILPANRVVLHAHYISHEMLPCYFIAADIVMLPYRHIYHSGIVHLAYSFARPVIATRVGDFSECIDEGKTGFVLAHNNAETLSATIVHALGDKSRLREMGAAARALSNSRYSWDTIGRLTKSAYLNLFQPLPSKS
jgi:D-inositol-3-phosphate glycosyltransferase